MFSVVVCTACVRASLLFSHLSSCGTSPQSPVSQRRLQKALQLTQLRGSMVDDFLSQYQLTAEEVAVLQGDAINQAFFAALERVRAIHANCRGLLRTSHQRAGLELMDAMAGHQERAYELLCRCVGELKTKRRKRIRFCAQC